MTVVKVVDPATPDGDFLKPDAGNRWVSVQFKLHNIGTTPYDDSPSNGSRITDQEDQHFDAAFAATTTAGPAMPAGVKLAPGKSAVGYITFELPKSSKLATVQFALDSGFSDDTGEWTIGPSSPTSSSAPAASSVKQSSTSAGGPGVGDTIDLTGADDLKVAVTVVKVVDPATPDGDFLKPDAGNRWVSVQFKLHNIGTTPYDDSPSNGSRITDQEDQHFDAAFAATTTAGPAMPAGVKLAPGKSAVGYITFELPKSSKLATVQFALDSGFSDDTGEWTIS